MKIFVTRNEDGSFAAGSIKNPIACMEIISDNKQLSDILDNGDLTEIDMINFEMFLSNFTIDNLSSILEIEE